MTVFPPRGARVAPILATSVIVLLLDLRASDFAPGLPTMIGAGGVSALSVLLGLLLGRSLRDGGF